MTELYKVHTFNPQLRLEGFEVSLKLLLPPSSVVQPLSPVANTKQLR